MLTNRLKKLFYFPIASYFAFFAKLYLLRWKPKIVVITGSSGKTTLLHMAAAQFKEKAKYSFHANSAYGIPFDILGIRRSSLSFFEWPSIILTTPFRIFRSIPKEKIYIVEADCDRPHEGKFLAKLLKPEVVLWQSLGRTHSMNFEHLVQNKNFSSLEEAISFEFGYLVEYSKSESIVNADSPHINKQLSRSNSTSIKIRLNDYKYKYDISKSRSIFTFDDEVYSFSYLLPKETIYSIIMLQKLMKYFNLDFDKKFKEFKLPPGRSSFFKGIKNIDIIDSSYNANLDSMKVIFNMFSNIKTKSPKWIVLGDMLEQGNNEQNEHELLAKEINKYKFSRIILMGPRISKFTKPLLNQKSVSFINPDQVLRYLLDEVKHGETILFKGARFLEGVVENLLLNKSDAKKLVRREKVWQDRRKKFGL
ncbi:MAG: cyanophycin synthetase [Candidatus Woesebacteria bacterium]|nr:cyanophycin synthetase [Candidatus Woesebacteria bacterium]